MPRKAHVYSHAAEDSSGLLLSRITATRTPSPSPMTIEATVSQSVLRRPSRTGPVKALSRWNAQPQLGLVSTLLTAIASRTASTATVIQRPGCRTGTARMDPGRASASVVEVVDVVTGPSG